MQQRFDLDPIKCNERSRTVSLGLMKYTDAIEVTSLESRHDIRWQMTYLYMYSVSNTEDNGISKDLLPFVGNLENGFCVCRNQRKFSEFQEKQKNNFSSYFGRFFDMLKGA